MSGFKRFAVVFTGVSFIVSSICGCTVNVHYTQPDDDTKEVSQKDIELESVDFDLSTYDEENKYMIFESHGNTFMLSDASAGEYPELDGRLTTIAEDEKSFYKQTIEDVGEDAAAFAAEQQKEGADYTYYRYSEMALKACDDKAVSLLRTEYGYLGGAHPDYYYETFNIDPKTGEDISLADVITDDDALRAVLIDKLNKEYPDGNFFDLEDSLSTYSIDEKSANPLIVPYTFTIDPAGLSFYFGPYELNSYADGSQQIDIFYEDISDILKEGFIYTGYEDEGRGDLITDEE